MLRSTLVLALSTCAALQGVPRVVAGEMVLDLDPAQSEVSFTLPDVVHTVHGTFKLKHGAISFDPATGKATGEVIVDVSSGDSGSPARDRRMHKDILESSRYPTAVFARSLRRTVWAGWVRRFAGARAVQNPWGRT